MNTATTTAVSTPAAKVSKQHPVVANPADKLFLQGLKDALGLKNDQEAVAVIIHAATGGFVKARTGETIDKAIERCVEHAATLPAISAAAATLAAGRAADKAAKKRERLLALLAELNDDESDDAPEGDTAPTGEGEPPADAATDSTGEAE